MKEGSLFVCFVLFCFVLLATLRSSKPWHLFFVLSGIVSKTITRHLCKTLNPFGMALEWLISKNGSAPCLLYAQHHLELPFVFGEQRQRKNTPHSHWHTCYISNQCQRKLLIFNSKSIINSIKVWFSVFQVCHCYFQSII